MTIQENMATRSTSKKSVAVWTGSHCHRFFPLPQQRSPWNQAVNILAKRCPYFAFDLLMLDFVEEEPFGIQLLGTLPWVETGFSYLTQNSCTIEPTFPRRDGGHRRRAHVDPGTGGAARHGDGKTIPFPKTREVDGFGSVLPYVFFVLPCIP